MNACAAEGSCTACAFHGLGGAITGCTCTAGWRRVASPSFGEPILNQGSAGTFSAWFLQDCASGDLPEVAFVDPPFFSEDSGTSSDNHPHGDIRAGEW